MENSVKKTPVLIADDDSAIIWVLERFFEEKSMDTVVARDGLEAQRLLKTGDFGLALLDINMPGRSGLEVLERSGAASRGIHVIVMTAESTMENTIEAMKLGAFDYITKPFDLGELEIIVDRAIEDTRLREKVTALTERLEERLAGETVFVGRSRPIQNVFKTIGRVAPREVDVLLLGESGTGKELAARIIHANSPRRAGPFVAVNIAAVTPELVESELFGHERGAFTGAHELRRGKFELARGGTLFLDEIGDMNPGLQAHLLRAVQEREFYRVGGSMPVRADVRIVAATNRDLAKETREARFREDLYFRLSAVTITMPPLRKRRSDIRLLASHFIKKFCREFEIPEKTVTEEALEEMKNYPWPGNVRELENVLRRAVLLTGSSTIGPAELGLNAGDRRSGSLEFVIEERLRPVVEKMDSGGNQQLYDLIMPFMERPLIKLVLEKTGGNQVKAAEALGINRNTLRKKIRELGIKVRRQGR